MIWAGKGHVPIMDDDVGQQSNTRVTTSEYPTGLTDRSGTWVAH